MSQQLWDSPKRLNAHFTIDFQSINFEQELRQVEVQGQDLKMLVGSTKRVDNGSDSQSQKNNFQPECLSHCNKRIMRKVDFSVSTIFKNKRIRKGHAAENKQSIRILKNITIFYLNVLESSKILRKTDIQAVEKFKKSNASLLTFKKLLKNQIIQQNCQKFYRSNEFISKIMKATTVNIRQKLSVIKYVQYFQLSLQGPLNQVPKTFP